MESSGTQCGSLLCQKHAGSDRRQDRRRYPRVLFTRLFSLPDGKTSIPGSGGPIAGVDARSTHCYDVGMETDADLERWRGWLLAGIVFERLTPTVTWITPRMPELSDPDDDFGAPVPVRPRKGPPLRSDRIALPEPEG